MGVRVQGGRPLLVGVYSQGCRGSRVKAIAGWSIFSGCSALRVNAIAGWSIFSGV